MTRASFGSRLAEAMTTHGPLCVGIDPHPGLLAAWGLADTAASVRSFATTVIDAVAGHVAAVKPQVAFFERHGAAGMAVLEEVVGRCRQLGLLCIIDAKRGDIGSTMAGYAQAYLSEGGAFAGDALTLSPFLGPASLLETIDTARAHGRGVFLLALTSNPEGRSVQHARTPAGTTIAADVAELAAAQNRGALPWGDVGLVVGATVGDAPRDTGVDLAGVNGPLLAPGFGAQGATLADLDHTFGTARGAVLVNSAREILGAGPEPQAIFAAARDLSTRLGASQRD